MNLKPDNLLSKTKAKYYDTDDREDGDDEEVQGTNSRNYPR